MKNKNSHDEIRLDVLGLFLAGLNNTFLALFVAVVIHGPGTIAQESELMMRANWITENIIHWKAGWLFWFAPTLSFSWSYYALGRHLDSTRQWYNLAIGVALIAAAVDIVGIMINLTVLPELASELAVTIANPDPILQIIFLSMEKIANNLTNVAGYGLYSLAGVLLLPAAFATPNFPRLLLWVGVTEWVISCIATVMLVLIPSQAIIPLVISFALYAPWVWGGAWWLLKSKRAT